MMTLKLVSANIQSLLSLYYSIEIYYYLYIILKRYCLEHLIGSHSALVPESLLPEKCNGDIVTVHQTISGCCSFLSKAVVFHYFFQVFDDFAFVCTAITAVVFVSSNCLSQSCFTAVLHQSWCIVPFMYSFIFRSMLLTTSDLLQRHSVFPLNNSWLV